MCVCILNNEQLNALSVTDSIDWKCRSCSGGVKPRRISCILPDLDCEESDAEVCELSSLGDKKSILMIFRQETRDIIRDELQATLDFYSKKIDEYEIKIREYENRMKIMENQHQDTKNRNINLVLQIEVLEQKVNKIEQAQSCNDVEICGIMERDNENLQEIISAVGRAFNMNTDAIIRARRKKKYPRADSVHNPNPNMPTPLPPPIVVTLRENCREQWLEASKNSRITDKDVGGVNDLKVIIREALSPTTAFLLWKTKNTLKEKSLCKYVWYKNGLIMVRKHENDKKVYTVRALGDIEKIAKDLQK
ncbi:hypothetical protein ACJJTC_014370 [Scirpophaga incertulas]